MSARAAAIEVLFRVAEKDAYASAALSAEIRHEGVSGRDAALATEIVYGSLRVLPELDATYGRHLSRPGGIDGYARAALRTATYELLHLSKIPARATVHATVTLVREVRGKQVGGFVNAVLRKVAAEAPEQGQPPTQVIVPDWLSSRLHDALGEERCEAFLSARPLPPPTGLRAADPADREALVADLRRSRPNAEIELGTVSTGGVLVRRGGDPTKLDGYVEGRFTIQEQGAQRVAELVLGAVQAKHGFMTDGQVHKVRGLWSHTDSFVVSTLR